jgi:hypothetical protein
MHERSRRRHGGRQASLELDIDRPATFRILREERTMIRTMLLAALPLLWAGASAAQLCSARVEGPPDGKWTTLAASPATGQDAHLRTEASLRCTGCTPEVTLLLMAGPASPALQTMPMGRKVGADWAMAVVEDPANREGFRRSVLRSELRSSSGCRLQGAVAGVETVGNLGTIATAIQAECPAGNISGEIYSTYDYTCQYQVQVLWPAGSLPAATQLEVGRLLRSIRFGQQ